MADSFYTAVTNSSGFGGVQRYVRAKNLVKGSKTFFVSEDETTIIPFDAIVNSDYSIKPEFLLTQSDFPARDVQALNDNLKAVANGEQSNGEVYIKYEGKILRLKTHLFVLQDTKSDESSAKEKFYVANQASKPLNRRGVVDSTKDNACLYISEDEITPPAFKRRNSFEVLEGRVYNSSQNNFDVISYTDEAGVRRFARDAEFGIDHEGRVWVNKYGSNEERVRTNIVLTPSREVGELKFYELPSDLNFGLYVSCDINETKTIQEEARVLDESGNPILDESGNPVVTVSEREVSAVELIQTSKIDGENHNNISVWCPERDRESLARFEQEMTALREELAYVQPSDNEEENRARLEEYRERFNAIVEPVKDLVKLNPQGEYQRKSVKDLVEDYQEKCKNGGFYPTTVYAKSADGESVNKCQISTDYKIEMTADLPYDWSQSKAMKSLIGKDTIVNNKPTKFHPDGSISVKFNPKASAFAEGALGIASMCFQATFGFGPFSVILWPVTIPGTLLGLGLSSVAFATEFIRTKIYKTAKINWYTRDPQRIKNLEIKAIEKECTKDLRKLHREYKRAIKVAQKEYSNIGFMKDAEGNIIKDEFGKGKTPLRNRLDELEREYQIKRAEILSKPNLLATAIMKSKYTVKDKKITAENILGRAEFVKQRRELRSKKKFADVSVAQKKEVVKEVDKKLKELKLEIKNEKAKGLAKQLKRLYKQSKKANGAELVELDRRIAELENEAKVLEKLQERKKTYKKDKKLAGKDRALLEKYRLAHSKTDDGSVITGYKTRKAELKRMKKDGIITKLEFKRELKQAEVQREKDKVDFFVNSGNLKQKIKYLKKTPQYKHATFDERKKMRQALKDANTDTLKNMSIETVRVEGKTDEEIEKFVKGLEKQEKRQKSKAVKENFNNKVDVKEVILNQNERLIKRSETRELADVIGSHVQGVDEAFVDATRIQTVLNVTNETNASASLQTLADSCKIAKQQNEQEVVKKIKRNLGEIETSSTARDMLKRFRETGELKHLADMFAEGKKIVDGREPTEKEVFDYFVSAIKSGKVDEQQLIKKAGLRQQKIDRAKKATSVLVEKLEKDGKLNEQAKQGLTEDLGILAKTFDRIVREQQKKKDPSVKLPKKLQSEKELSLVQALIKQNSPEHAIEIIRDSQIFKTEYERDVKRQTQENLDRIRDKALASDIEGNLPMLAKAYYETLTEENRPKGKFEEHPSQAEMEKIFVESLSKDAETQVEMLKKTASFKAEKKRLQQEKKAKEQEEKAKKEKTANQNKADGNKKTADKEEKKEEKGQSKARSSKSASSSSVKSDLNETGMISPM